MHLIVDVQDAMGANLINSMLEHLASPIEETTGGRVHLRILKPERPTSGMGGRVLPWRIWLLAIIPAKRCGTASSKPGLRGLRPYRAATHNKGVMNGIDAVVLACANDWRAVEAGAHAYAARRAIPQPDAMVKG